MARKLAFTLIIFLILVAFLEVGARFLESNLTRSEPVGQNRGWQETFFGSVFDWHEPDPDLLWRFKANLDNPLIKTNNDHFIGATISDRKPEDVYRILLLGDSSPVGLGLGTHDQTFGALLEHILKTAYLDRGQVELINAAVSGYTSEQIKKLLDLRLWNLDPDLVLLYCGNNDASISGHLSDRELLRCQRLPGLRRALGHLALYRLLRSFLSTAGEERPVESAGLTVRVSPEEYRENLRGIAQNCRSHGCSLIVIKPPVPRLWPAGLQFRPFTHVTGEDGEIILPDELAGLVGRNVKYCLDQGLFANLYGTVDMFTSAVYSSAYRDSLTADNAITHYQHLLASDPDAAILLNNLGVSYWQKGWYDMANSALRQARTAYVSNTGNARSPALFAAGSPILYNLGINLLAASHERPENGKLLQQQANAYLDSALQADYFSLRIKQDYWDMIDTVGKCEGVEVLDLPTLFEVNGGERLFIDHCHPTAEGHLLIARALAETIVRLRR